MSSGYWKGVVMQAIETHYLPRTETKPARVVAKCQASKVIVSWDENLNVEDNHHAAAKALAKKLEWHGVWMCGAKANGKGNVYVCIEYHAKPGRSPYAYETGHVF